MIENGFNIRNIFQILYALLFVAFAKESIWKKRGKPVKFI